MITQFVTSIVRGVAGIARCLPKPRLFFQGTQWDHKSQLFLLQLRTCDLSLSRGCESNGTCHSGARRSEQARLRRACFSLCELQYGDISTATWKGLASCIGTAICWASTNKMLSPVTLRVPWRPGPVFLILIALKPSMTSSEWQVPSTNWTNTTEIVAGGGGEVLWKGN